MLKVMDYFYLKLRKYTYKKEITYGILSLINDTIYLPIKIIFH